ncbi:MAG: LysM peptidoglycan-binding domain-containing protein [Betaproteobacteria bacterium]|nr:LysM peptidoglycan-binding domain-containing protein [Betaproteobacteria bacterium]
MHERKPFPRVARQAAILLAMASGTMAVGADEARAPLTLVSMLVPGTRGPAAALSVEEVRQAPAVARSVDLTAPTDNLWDRIRHGFAMTDLEDNLTLHYQQWYQNRPDALRRMIERSRPYLHHIVEEIEARGMPTELALLPMVESSFNPMAYSRAHASGLWQFIPATGKRFNLEQSWWQDQRRDIVASTGAALEYLHTVYDMHGDWHLALASYNWGEGAVKRAIEKNEAKGLPTDYASLNMPTETRHYVPKLQALKNIFSNPSLMASLGLPEVMNRPYFATVPAPRPMDVKTAARLADMPVDQFVALNPAHNRPVMKAETPVVIPAEKMSTFQSNLQRHAAPLTEWEAYSTRQGERIEDVSARFGIALPDLLRANGLQGRVRLAAGSTLLVPAGRGAGDIDALGDDARIIAVPEPEPRAPVAKGKGRAEKPAKAATPQVAATGVRKDAARPAAKTTAKAAAKPAAETRVARSGNGRRG